MGILARVSFHQTRSLRCIAYMVTTQKHARTRQTPSLIRKPKFTASAKLSRRLNYPAATKASDKYKIQCNALIGRLAADCTSAVVLDTSFFKTVQSILYGNGHIKRILCPQMDVLDYERMKRGLRYRRFKGKEKVTLMHSSMGGVIDTEMAPLFGPKSKVLVWHDAMSTWRAETHGNTSIKSDVMNILRMFKQSHAHSMVLAVTICTRSKLPDNELCIGGNKTIILSDVINMAQDQGARIHLIDEFTYPQMFFLVMEVSHLGVPKKNDINKEKSDCVFTGRPIYPPFLEGSTYAAAPSIEPLKEEGRSVCTPSRRNEGVRVKAMFNDGNWYTGTLRRFTGKARRITFYIRFDEKDNKNRYIRYYVGEPDPATIHSL